jgi:hypothetical protein
MNKEQFIEILNTIKLLEEQQHEYHRFGIDLVEGPVPIVETSYKIIDLFFKSHYNEFGIDWINWFMYENDFGDNNLEATDEGKLICQTAEDLYDYIEQYKHE